MPFPSESQLEDKLSSRDLSKLISLFSSYKVPLLLVALGALIFLSGSVLNYKASDSQPEVVFDTEASGSAKTTIIIDIQGAVEKPGVYEFREGERVADALTQAGGLSAGADREWLAKNLNRAAKLTDGGKLYIPAVSETTSHNSSVSYNLQPTTYNLLGVSAGKVNVNTASKAQLEVLSGIGPATAEKVIAGRPYASVEELLDKKVLGASLYSKLKDLLTVY